jgi:hypothetical protein
MLHLLYISFGSISDKVPITGGERVNEEIHLVCRDYFIQMGWIQKLPAKTSSNPFECQHLDDIVQSVQFGSRDGSCQLTVVCT